MRIEKVCVASIVCDLGFYFPPPLFFLYFYRVSSGLTENRGFFSGYIYIHINWFSLLSFSWVDGE